MCCLYLYINAYFKVYLKSIFNIININIYYMYIYYTYKIILFY